MREITNPVMLPGNRCPAIGRHAPLSKSGDRPSAQIRSLVSDGFRFAHCRASSGATEVELRWGGSGSTLGTDRWLGARGVGFASCPGAHETGLSDRGRGVGQAQRRGGSGAQRSGQPVGAHPYGCCRRLLFSGLGSLVSSAGFAGLTGHEGRDDERMRRNAETIRARCLVSMVVGPVGAIRYRFRPSLELPTLFAL